MGDSENVARKLVVLSGKAKGTSYILTDPEVKAGRERDNAICLKGKRVSRHHAVLLRTNGEYTIRDLGPRIGTLLNGRPRREATLKLGDRIRIGEFEMRYEEAAESPTPSPSAATSPQTDELTVLRLELAAAKKETDEARTLAECTAAELVCMRVEAEKSVSEYQQRAAGLMQENERLVGEANRASEALESSLRTQAQKQSDQELSVLEQRLSALSQEKTALAERNTELQVKISKLEECAREANRLETELANAQAALQQMSEQLAQDRKSTKLDTIAEELNRMLHSAPAGSAGELDQFEAALAEARGEWDKISDLHIRLEQLMMENHNLQIAATKAQEEAARARRCLSDHTIKEFDQIRRAFVAKQNDKPNNKSFWPFKAAARIP
jgi:pSer/pThr/pTyr-binding forkhead associated (FHA) protein